MTTKEQQEATRILGKYISNDDLHNEYEIYKAMQEYADSLNTRLDGTWVKASERSPTLSGLKWRYLGDVNNMTNDLSLWEWFDESII